jgi:hypothetical protein
MKMVERQYEFISKSYMGHIYELITKIKNLEEKYEKQELNHQLELSKEKHETNILKKDMKIMKLMTSVKNTNIKKKI